MGQQFALGLARYSINLDQGYSCYFIHLFVQPMLKDLKSPHTTSGSWQADNGMLEFSSAAFPAG